MKTADEMKNMTNEELTKLAEETKDVGERMEAWRVIWSRDPETTKKKEELREKLGL